jgi:hypothetical protein
MAQFAPAIQSGESPIAEAARWFSAVAGVARRRCVHRKKAHGAPLRSL